MLYIQELLTPIFIFLKAFFMIKNGYFRPEKHHYQRFEPLQNLKKVVFKLISGII